MIRMLLITTALGLAPIATAQHQISHDDHTAHGGAADHATDYVTLSRTDEIDIALSAGGEPVVVEVLGVVCDFCAKAMNRTFGRRDDVSAVHVDLDTKTLNLVLVSGAAIDDAEINRVVEDSGYKTKAIHRREHIRGVGNAPDPA